MFTNKHKGIYTIWLTINFILLITSGNIKFADSGSQIHDKWPLQRWYPNCRIIISGEWTESLSFNPKYSYDLSEFLLYSFVPLLLFVSYKLIIVKKE